MSIINLMLLGFLLEKPMNAYEIKKTVENRNLTWWIKGSSPSIYRNVHALATKGYLDGEVVREGEMPEKTIYTINEKGRQYFQELMWQYASTPPPVYLDFTAVLSHIGKVDQTTGEQLINALIAAFTQNLSALESIEGHFAPYQAKAIIQLSQQMNALFCHWLTDFKTELYVNSASAPD